MDPSPSHVTIFAIANPTVRSAYAGIVRMKTSPWIRREVRISLSFSRERLDGWRRQDDMTREVHVLDSEDNAIRRSDGDAVLDSLHRRKTQK